MKKIILAFLLSFVASGYAFSQGNPSAETVLANVVKKLMADKGSEAKFKINNSGYSGNGLLKSSGKKYRLQLPDAEIWYDGKDLYTYNKGTNETTVVTPTAEELAESNPFMYVASAQRNYNVTYSTVKKTGRYVLELTPKTKNADVKRVTLTVSRQDYNPEKIVVEPRKGSPISVEILSFKNGLTLSASEFQYPASKYPNIVDLR